VQKSQLLVGRCPLAAQPQPDAAQQLVGGEQGKVDPVRELHCRQPFGVGLVVRQDAQHVGVDADHARVTGAQGRDGEVDLLERRLAGGEQRRELRTARTVDARRDALRRPCLVDEVQGAGVRDARHDHVDELLDALARPAGSIGESLDLDEQPEAVIARLGGPEPADTRSGEDHAHLRAPTRRALADVTASRHRGHHGQAEPEPRAVGARGSSRGRRRPPARARSPHQVRR
jgi:hypothetical protein